MARCFESDPFTIDFETPRTESIFRKFQEDFLSWGGAPKVIYLLLMLIFQRPNPATGGFLELGKCFERDPFTIDFEAPGAQSGFRKLQADFLSWWGGPKAVRLLLILILLPK